MATYSEIWNELVSLRTKWRSMTDEERSSSDGLAMEERTKGLKERLVAMESGVEIYCKDKFRHEQILQK